MDANEREIIYEEEVFDIVGCAMTVLNELGHGLLEKPYENALVVELGINRIPVQQQPRFQVRYKGVVVGDYIPDLIAFDRIVVDTKVIEKISDHEVGQMINYLKITGLKLGVVLNFKRAKLEWRRVAFDTARKGYRLRDRRQ